MSQLFLLVNGPSVICALHRLHLTCQFRCTTCVDGGDLLVANEQLLAIDAFAETHSVLTSAHTIVRRLRAHSIEKV